MTLKLRSVKYTAFMASEAEFDEEDRLKARGWRVVPEINEDSNKEWLEIDRQIRSIDEVSQFWGELILNEPPTKISVTFYNTTSKHVLLRRFNSLPGNHSVRYTWYTTVNRKRGGAKTQVYVCGGAQLGEQNLELFLQVLCFLAPRLNPKTSAPPQTV